MVHEVEGRVSAFFELMNNTIPEREFFPMIDTSAERGRIAQFSIFGRKKRLESILHAVRIAEVLYRVFPAKIYEGNFA